jgi:ubiquinone/menaquinone biosynthesis C-methylase UbiE
MHEADRFKTIDNDWDRLYREYPEIYDRFAERIDENHTLTKAINRKFRLEGKTVLDVGSGTGSSTLSLAKYAHFW